MVATKQKIIDKLLLLPLILFIVAFPLGQLIRVEEIIAGGRVVIQPIDVIAALSVLFILPSKLRFPKIFKYITNFILLALFSLVISLEYFNLHDVVIGSFYLARLVAYSGFFIYCTKILKDENIKIKVFNILIIAIIFSAILGWIQYFFFPDLRSLVYAGWDDHLYRLAGVYLDPGYTGLILTFGFLSTFTKYLKKAEGYLIIILLFLLATIVYTYSRTSYLALLCGTTFLLITFRNNIKIFIAFLIIFISLVISLPRPQSEGVKLERTNSVIAKAENYIETFNIIKKNPLFGVGYNNICFARIKYFGVDNIYSHSCYGSDSSPLFILATTGVVGFLFFINLVIRIAKLISPSLYSVSFAACGVALIVDSLFINSIFYAWVMGWLGIFLAMSVKKKS